MLAPEFMRRLFEDERLLLYGQPIVAFDSGEPAIELLARVRVDETQVLAPSEFLPCLEAFGGLEPLDTWVCERAIELAAGGTRVYANLSPPSLSSARFIRRLRTVLDRELDDTSRVVFELTETCRITDFDAVVAGAHAIRDLGCGLALDDFGAAYAGLKYLKRIPFSHLKIDIEFVNDLAHCQASRDVVRAIVLLARAFGCSTIAEGIENQMTEDLVRELGVDSGQGFHLGRPKPLTGACLKQPTTCGTAPGGG